MLTDEQIDELASEEGLYPKCGDAVLADVSDVRAFARAIESAVHRALNPSVDQSGADGEGVQAPVRDTER